MFIPNLLNVLIRPSNFDRHLLLRAFLYRTLGMLPPHRVPISYPLMFPTPIRVFVNYNFRIIGIPRLVVVEGRIIINVTGLCHVIRFTNGFRPPNVSKERPILSRRFPHAVYRDFRLSVEIFNVRS